MLYHRPDTFGTVSQILRSQVGCHVLRHPQVQKVGRGFLPSRLLPGRPWDPLHREPAKKEGGQRQTDQQSPKPGQAHRPVRQADRGRLHFISGSVQEIGQPGQVAEQGDIVDQQDQHHRPALRIQEGQSGQEQIKHDQRAGGAGSLFLPGFPLDSPDPLPQTDILKQRDEQGQIDPGGSSLDSQQGGVNQQPEKLTYNPI